MTNPTIALKTPAVKPIAIVYECQPAAGKSARVTVTKAERAPLYECNCPIFSVWGDCQHAEAVRAERKAQGRQ